MTYYISIETYGTNHPHIIDDNSMDKAEVGLNYLCPDDFMYLCDAEDMQSAVDYYFDIFSQLCFDIEAEKYHM